MNKGHASLCGSPGWAAHLAGTVLPAALDGLTLGDDVLEVGPGYGAATARLAELAPMLTAVEVDATLAGQLAADLPGVSVVHGSGDDLPFPDGRFSAVVCFTMLHHVASPDRQDALFAEARRVLRADGLLAGSDSVGSPGLQDFHGCDTYQPVDPAGLPRRLAGAGFTRVDVRVPAPGTWFTFSARA